MKTAPILLVLFAVYCILLVLSYALRKRLPAIRAKPILTKTEREFFNRLLNALPDYHVFPQVAFGAILKTTKARGRFSQKITDFVVCDKDTLEILAIIELDDKTHNLQKDKARDAMLNAAGYRTIRFQCWRNPSEEEIASHFEMPDPVSTEPQFF